MGTNVARSSTSSSSGSGAGLPLLRGLRLGQAVAAPGRFNRSSRTPWRLLPVRQDARWQFFPEHVCLGPLGRQGPRTPKRLRAQLRPRERAVGQGGSASRPDRTWSALDLSTFELEFGPNLTRHPARFPSSSRLLHQAPDEPGQLVLDPFGGHRDDGGRAENLGRRVTRSTCVAVSSERRSGAASRIARRAEPEEIAEAMRVRRAGWMLGRSGPTGA